MLEIFSQIVEHLAPLVVATHLLFLLIVAIFGGVAVVFLSPYVGRFAMVSLSSSVRFVGFLFTWQPKELVGTSRDQRQRLSDTDSSAAHPDSIIAPEEHKSPSRD